ncbi:hypothetical protein IWW36_003522 [Coemansia brasiliensis]|uniref:NudC domain-containing protein 1 n=1 Tax=Coemansia brasiliensis TaxID=2650707 RepID=A0A9W8LYW8_9FUNG|nr:hypothetical protein IWW36_003522 [Coemansia brasiliensis]
MYEVLELKPDSALINPQFDGYKLRLIDSDGKNKQSAIRHYELSEQASVEPYQLASNALLTYNEMYSRVHYNHLFIGPNEHSVIYIDSNRHVYLVDIHKHDAPTYTLMFEIPSSSSMYVLQGYHGAYAIDKNMVLVFDGMFSVYVLQYTASNDQSAAWKATGVFEVGCGSVAAGPTIETAQRTMYYVIGAHLVHIENEPVIHMHICYRSNKQTAEDLHSSSNMHHPATSYKRPTSSFCIQAIQIKIPPNSCKQPEPVPLDASIVHTLYSHAVPVYCEYISHSQYMLGVKKGVVLDDTEMPTQPLTEGIPPTKESFPYYWTQTQTDVTVCIDLPVAIKANQVTCKMERSSLTLQFLGSAECTEKYTYESRQFCDFIIADESVWTLENGRLLTFYLQKEHEGARWASVFKDDDGVLETIDPSEFVTIRERLEKYTANGPDITAPDVPLMQPYVDQDSGGDPEQQEQIAEEPVIFSVRSWSTGLAEASSVVGSPDWLCSAFSRASNLSETPLPPVCLKFDVDGVVFTFHTSTPSNTYQKSHLHTLSPSNISPPAHSNVCARHASTFSALSYVQAGKREKRFMYIDSDMTVAVLAEAQRRVYIYHQTKHTQDSSAIQNIVDLGGSNDEAEILGIQLIGRILVILRKHLLTMVDLDLC